jgi:fumarate reductase subunit C
MASAHPDAMRPSKPGSTRTAPPQGPPQFPSQGRYLPYVLFDATGLVYLLLGFVALRVVWALGSGPAAWQSLMDQLTNPLYVAFHALGLASVIFVGVRFFRLFPKANPPTIGPLKPPPRPVIHAMLYAAWVGVAGAMTIVLAGGIF